MGNSGGNHRPRQVLTGVGILLLLGTFTPWWVFTAGPDSSAGSFSGTETTRFFGYMEMSLISSSLQATLCLVIAAIAVVAVVREGVGTRWASVVVGALGAVVVGFNLYRVSELNAKLAGFQYRIDSSSFGESQHGFPGPGVILPLIGSILVLGLGAWSLVAAQPATAGSEAAEAATSSASWRTDPSGRHELRYWDGGAWTEHVSDSGAQSSDPM